MKNFLSKILNKVTAAIAIIVAAVSTVFSMVFYTKLQAEVNRLQKEKKEREEADAAKLKEVKDRYEKEIQEQQELKSKVVNNDSNINNDYVTQLMQNTTKKGNKRNNTGS